MFEIGCTGIVETLVYLLTDEDVTVRWKTTECLYVIACTSFKSSDYYLNELMFWCFSLSLVLHVFLFCNYIPQYKEPIRPGSDFKVPIRPHLVQKWPQVDFKSRLVPKMTWGDLGKKQPTFNFKSTSYMALCCLPSFIMIASWGLVLKLV